MNYHLYIAACDEHGGILHYRLGENGIPVFCDSIPLPRPMYFCLNGSQMHVLLRAPWNGNQNSALCTLDIIPDGSLQGSSDYRSTEGIVACHLSAVEDMVYTANYLSGSLTRLSLTSSDIQTVTHTGHSVHPTRQNEAHTHYIAPIPNTEYLAAVDLGEDRIYVYDLKLHLISYVTMPEGCGPRHLAWSEDGQYAYCSCELSSEIAVLTYEDGSFTYHERYSTLPLGIRAEDCANTASAIRCYGDIVAVSNRGHDSVVFYRRTEDGGLQVIGFVPVGGQSPRDFDLVGEFLICTNEKSNTVTVFRLHIGEDGFSAVMCAEICDVPSPLCVMACSVC